MTLCVAVAEVRRGQIDGEAVARFVGVAGYCLVAEETATRHARKYRDESKLLERFQWCVVLIASLEYDTETDEYRDAVPF